MAKMFLKFEKFVWSIVHINYYLYIIITEVPTIYIKF